VSDVEPRRVGRIGRMRDVQAPYFEAVERLDGLERERSVPEGYERNYRRGKTVVTVCPWHWRQYSHYQFWEVYAAARLARLAGAARTILVTNEAWSGWCWDGFDDAFDAVVVGEPSETAGELAARLRERGRRDAPPPPLRGASYFGRLRPHVSTVRLKEALGEGLRAVGENARTRPRLPVTFGNHHVTVFASLSNGLVVDAKGFRNPEPIHEAKILAGKAFAIGPERAARLLYVVDGRVSAADLEVVLLAGASITTPDRYRDAVLDLSGRIT
jgi:hypothetical protein